MKNVTRYFLIVIGLFVLAGVFRIFGARINTTRSYPPGLYWLTGEALRKGALVIACPPPVKAVAEALRRGYLNAGFCPGGYGYIIKKIVAIPGDRVVVTGQGVSVNGEAIPNSALRRFDTEGKPLPFNETAYTLGTAQVLLMSDYSPKSFDGRYFGPMSQTGIKGVLKPVFTWSSS
jgi:conjugative transfer signal peptidase TraF